MTKWDHTTPAPNFKTWMKEFREIAFENDRSKRPYLCLNATLALKLDEEGMFEKDMTLFNYKTFFTVKEGAPLYEFLALKPKEGTNKQVWTRGAK